MAFKDKKISVLGYKKIVKLQWLATSVKFHTQQHPSVIDE
jgi:hypothetical protein